MFENEVSGDYVKIGLGQEAIVRIGACNKVESNPDSVIGGLTKDKKDIGYYYEVETDKGTLTVNSWVLLKALSPYEEGDTLMIKHPASGKYEINKVENALE